LGCIRRCPNVQPEWFLHTWLATRNADINIFRDIYESCNTFGRREYEAHTKTQLMVQ